MDDFKELIEITDQFNERFRDRDNLVLEFNSHTDAGRRELKKQFVKMMARGKDYLAKPDEYYPDKEEWEKLKGRFVKMVALIEEFLAEHDEDYPDGPRGTKQP